MSPAPSSLNSSLKNTTPKSHVLLTLSLHLSLVQLHHVQQGLQVVPKKARKPLTLGTACPWSSITSIKPPATAAPGLLCGCWHIIKIYRPLSIKRRKKQQGTLSWDTAEAHTLLVPGCPRDVVGWHKSNPPLEQAASLSIPKLPLLTCFYEL